MEKLLVIWLLVIGFLFFGSFKIYQEGDKQTELSCRQDCEKMSATYAHHDMGSNGQTSRCSCNKDGEIKPIW